MTAAEPLNATAVDGPVLVQAECTDGFLTTRCGVHALSLHGVVQGNPDPIGVLCVPSMADSWMRAYRGVRAAAMDLASHGIPTVRMDWAGMGRSPRPSNEPFTSQLAAVVHALRESGGPTHWCLLAHGIGAAIAARVCAEDAALSLIAWAPEWSGRGFLRRAHAFDQLLALGLEGHPTCVNGYVLSSEAYADLRSITATPPSAPQLLASLVGARAVTDLSDMHTLDGLAEDVNAIRQVVLDRRRSLVPGARWCDPVVAPTVPLPTGGRIDVARVGTPAVRGVWCRPAPGARTGVGVVLLNPGIRPAEGPFHFGVEFGLAMAEEGHVVLLADQLGMGDSDGRPGVPDHSPYPADAGATVRSLVERMGREEGIRSIALGGFCSAAYTAIVAVAEGVPVDLVLAVNPQLYASGSQAEWQARAAQLKSGQWMHDVFSVSGSLARATRALRSPVRALRILARQLAQWRGSHLAATPVPSRPSTDPATAGAVGCPRHWFPRDVRYALVFGAEDLGLRYLRTAEAPLLRALRRDPRVSWTEVPGDDHVAARPATRAVAARAFAQALAEQAARLSGAAPR